MVNLNHYIYSISDIRELINDESHFLNYIQEETNKFQTSSNPSIGSYLKDKALIMNDQNSIRTYLIIDTDTLEIIGYFCLKIVNVKFEDDVSGNIKKKISSDAKKNDEFQALLITKLGRNDNHKKLIPGKIIMEYALSIGIEIYKRTALRHICVDWYEDSNLRNFYCDQCGFKIFQEKDTGKGKLVSAFYKFD
ncbi:hypothetical protein QNN38_02830 [Staphylococcus argenteus]|uniref:hypothetical protein n=1 Tax=Staphylococcus argenteus TaxID=985002 RepID=UPI002FCA4E6B